MYDFTLVTASSTKIARTCRLLYFPNARSSQHISTSFINADRLVLHARADLPKTWGDCLFRQFHDLRTLQDLALSLHRVDEDAFAMPHMPTWIYNSALY